MKPAQHALLALCKTAATRAGRTRTPPAQPVLPRSQTPPPWQEWSWRIGGPAVAGASGYLGGDLWNRTLDHIGGERWVEERGINPYVTGAASATLFGRQFRSPQARLASGITRQPVEFDQRGQIIPRPHSMSVGGTLKKSLLYPQYIGLVHAGLARPRAFLPSILAYIDDMSKGVHGVAAQTTQLPKALGNIQTLVEGMSDDPRQFFADSAARALAGEHGHKISPLMHAARDTAGGLVGSGIGVLAGSALAELLAGPEQPMPGQRLTRAQHRRNERRRQIVRILGGIAGGIAGTYAGTKGSRMLFPMATPEPSSGAT